LRHASLRWRRPPSRHISVLALVETAAEHGDLTGLIHAAGISPSQAPIEAILAVTFAEALVTRGADERERETVSRLTLNL
jgi:hypothetical protein